MPLDFDGLDDKSVLPADMTSVGGLSVLSACAWVYMHTYHQGVLESDILNFSINNSGTPTNASRCTLFAYRVNGKPGWSAKAPDTASAQAAIGDTSIPLSTWTHIAGSIDIANDNGLIWMNAVPQTLSIGPPSFTATAIDTGPSTSNDVGASDMGTTEYFDGLLADVRFYNRLLTTAEVEAIYSRNGHDNVVYGLVNRWAFDENADGVTASAAGENKDWGNDQAHGTPTNGPIFRSGPLTVRQRYR